MSKDELKNKAQQLTRQPGKVANFLYKAFMSIMVSLCLFAIKTGFNEGKEIVMKPIAKFNKLQVDRDSDKIEHTWITQMLHKQDSTNHVVSDTLQSHSADINELQQRTIGLDLQMGHKEDK